ncbi:hypothetical protein D3C83_280270 [compost metagenome]
MSAEVRKAIERELREQIAQDIEQQGRLLKMVLGTSERYDPLIRDLASMVRKGGTS